MRNDIGFTGGNSRFGTSAEAEHIRLDIRISLIESGCIDRLSNIRRVVHPAQCTNEVDLFDWSVSAVGVQTERVVLVLGLEHIAGGIKRTVVVTESSAQDNRLVCKFAVVAHDESVGVGVITGFRNTRGTEALVFLFAADNINPQMVAAFPLAHDAVFGEGFVLHGDASFNGIGCRVQVVHRYGHRTACEGDISHRVQNLGLACNIQFFVAKYAANEVGTCVAGLAVEHIVVGDIRNRNVRINGADIGQRRIDPNLARIVVQLQDPINAGAVLRQSVEVVARPTARPHTVGFISVCDVAVDDCVVTDFLNIAENEVCTRFDCDLGNIGSCVERRLTVGKDCTVDNRQRILSEVEISVSDLDVIVLIRPDFRTDRNSASGTCCHVGRDNKSARCSARHGRRADGISPIKTALRSEVQIAVVLHVDIRVDNVVLRIDLRRDTVFRGSVLIVADNQVAAVKIGFTCIETAFADVDQTVVYR